MKPFLWAELTWEQIRDMRADGVDMVIFPVGSTEQHGPHLPLNVDTLCAETVAHAISTRTSVPVLPALPFGCPPCLSVARWDTRDSGPEHCRFRRKH